MEIFCCGCQRDIQARLTDGGEIYPHRNDLKKLPFWKCDTCGNYVGCHHKTQDRTKPLGCIPTDEIKKARQHIHRMLDPIWQRNGYHRGRLYGQISEKLGWKYHTADIRSIEQAREAYAAIKAIINGATND